MVDWEAWKKKLEVPKDEDSGYSNDSLTNRDLIPFGPDRRTWNPFAYSAYWLVESLSITGYTTGSSLVGFGLSVKQSILCSFGAGAIYGLFAAVMGSIGAKYHVGYPVIARMQYGIRGSTFGIIMRIITGIIWWGVQAYFGAQAFAVMISAMRPSFATWDSFDNKNGITSANFVGLFLYCLCMIPCTLIKPENLHWFFRSVTFLIMGTLFGLLGYSVKNAHGVGVLFTESNTFTSNGTLAWACIKGIFSIVGSAGTGILGQSDFTRYATTRSAPIYSQIIGAPAGLTVACIIGAISTSASYEFLGVKEWNPVLLMAKILVHENYSAASRAAVFFGALTFVLQQLAINLLLNSLSSSMDMTGLCPKYLNIKRSGFIVMSLGILIWPWKILTSAKAVIVFGNGWGCFCSSQTGIIIAKYFIIYRRKMLLKDLYIDSEESIYWFYNGFDWRSILSFFIGTVFLIPGLAWDTQGRSNGFWTWMYQISYLSGIIISMTSEIALHTLFPQKDIKPSTKVEDVFNEDGSRIESAEKIEGVTVEVVETVSIENKSKMS
jgi:NCS1 family nucleobase:cation symporter-1